MPDGVKEVNGRLMATARDIPPPRGWTNDYEELGGDDTWGPEGTITLMLYDAGMDATGLKPLYVMQAWMGGGGVIMFEAGSPTAFYMYSPMDNTIHQMTLMKDLQSIVDWMNDEDKGGYASLQTKRVA